MSQFSLLAVDLLVYPLRYFYHGIAFRTYLLSATKIPQFIQERAAMELYRELSLDEEIRKAGAPLSKSFGWYTVHTLSELALDKRDAPNQKWTSDEVSPAQGNRCTQDLAEPILLEAARKHGGDLRFHTELTSLEQNDGHVVASVLDRSTGTEEMVMAQFTTIANLNLTNFVHPSSLGRCMNNSCSIS